MLSQNLLSSWSAFFQAKTFGRSPRRLLLLQKKLLIGCENGDMHTRNHAGSGNRDIRQPRHALTLGR